MMRIRQTTLLVAALAATSLTACDWMDMTIEPQTILTDQQVWGDPSLIEGVLADYYDRLPIDAHVSNYVPVNYMNAVHSGSTDIASLNLTQYNYNWWTEWGGNSHYDLIRDIHVAMDGIAESESPTLSEAQRLSFLGELRFLRAMVYFDLVKKMGGVPLVTEQLIYTFDGDATPLQLPRATEAGVYDFIASEMDAIVGQLGNQGSVTRANRYTALALKSRAMLYAGSIARHNSEMAEPITLPGGEVGIPASSANQYYQASLEASKQIINSGVYSLYNANPDPGQNFADLFLNTPNGEMIMIEAFDASVGRSHDFTRDHIARSLVTDASAITGGSVESPSLQLVEDYGYFDGSSGEMRGVGDGTKASQANWIFYDNIEDIFDGKDGRLYGTVVLPGSTFAGENITLQAGVYVWNGADYDRVTGNPGTLYDDGGVLAGVDGPQLDIAYTSATGFLVRKFLDPDPAARQQAIDSDVAWVKFRLGEIYLNAAEAAFELGQTGEAIGYMNTLRERAGYPAGSLTTLDRETIVSERNAELAFEDHREWDLHRWRLAHILYNGIESRTARVWALFPYRVIRPGHPNHNKYVFDQFPSPKAQYPRFFRMGNYYSEIPTNVLNANPNIVRNPFH